MTFSDQIRTAIQRSKLSRYRLSKESGIDQAALCRFLQGSGLTSSTLDALADVLRLSVKVKGPRKALLNQR
jgi:transcriptional regulator with XRE-family HTH domain